MGFRKPFRRRASSTSATVGSIESSSDLGSGRTQPSKPDDARQPLDPRLPSEHVEQREFVSWFRKRWPGVRIIAIPNGGIRGAAAGARLKAEGVSAGVPDLYIPAWKLWIEMKRQRDYTVSREQRDWIDYLQKIGDCAIVCRGFNDARTQVLNWRGEDE